MKIVFCTGSLETIPSNPQKPNLTLQFLRTARTPDKQKQTQGHKLYSKVLAIEPNRLHKIRTPLLECMARLSNILGTSLLMVHGLAAAWKTCALLVLRQHRD